MSWFLVEMAARSLGVYVVPAVIGWAVVSVGGRQRTMIEKLPLYFIVGMLLVFGLAFTPIFIPATIAMGASGLLLYGRALWTQKLWNFQVIRVLAGVAVLAVAAYGMWLVRSPYILNWDWYEHETMARLILQGKISFFTSQVSDTFGFNSYPPIFHALMAVGQAGARLSPAVVLAFWQFTGFWHLVSVGLAAWALGYVASGKKLAAWLAAVIGVITFDPFMSFTSFFFLPQTLAAVLFVGLFTSLVKAEGEGKKVSLLEVTVGAAGLGLLHYLVGGVAAAVYVGAWVIQKARWLMPLLLVAAVAGFLLVPQLSLGFLNHGEAAGYVAQTSEQVGAIEQTYGYLAYLLAPLGVLVLLRNKRPGAVLAAEVGFGLVLLAAAAVPYAWKLFTLTRFFVGLALAMGLWSILSLIQSKLIKALAVGTVAASLLLILAVNSMYWKDGIAVGSRFQHLSGDEIASANYLEQTYRSQRVLLSADPTTQYVLEGLSGVDTPGGAFMNEENRIALAAAINLQDPGALVSYARSVQDGVPGKVATRLLAISGRTFVWKGAKPEDQKSFSYNVWTPQEMSVNQLQYADRLAALPGVKLVFRNGSVYLYEVGSI